jgi:hypothetical protein
MNEIQRATQAQPATAGLDLIVGGPQRRDLTDYDEEDRALRRSNAAWQLRREKILFFYALLALPLICALALWAGSMLAACVFLTMVGSGLVHFLTGSSPQVASLLGALIRAWSHHAKGGPHE